MITGICIYFSIGIVLGWIATDHLFHDQHPLITTGEIMICMIFWPIILLNAIFNRN
jgi:hypothetical protein